MSQNIHSSFRDPSGFVFKEGGVLYRQVNETYRRHYDLLMSSGLYQKLVDNGLLVAHQEEAVFLKSNEQCYKILRPEVVPFISYPYEWSFSQLKQAALVTLKIQKTVLDYGMVLKDASAYNIQFKNGHPVLIDTLSFEQYEEGKPWIAYRQFCQHFFAPLALMSYKDIRLGQLLRVHLDGVPLDLASRLLPFRTCLKFSLLVHIHLHAGSQKYFSSKEVKIKKSGITKTALLGLIDNLEGAVRGLRWTPRSTEWADYYDMTNYTDAAFSHKKQTVADFLDKARPGSVWDLGANTGIFSRMAGSRGIKTVAFDVDPAAVEKNYLECLKNNEANLLPLLMDLTNPSPAIGWDNRERMSLGERGPADLIIALALIHHLAISNNVPFDKLAAFFSKYCRWLIIEFVPRSDEKVKRLLSFRTDDLKDYTETAFKGAFSNMFDIVDFTRITNSERTVFLLKNKTF